MTDITSIERLFNLGEFNNIRITVADISKPLQERRLEMLERILDIYEAFFLQQTIRYMLQDNEELTEIWFERYKNLLKNRDTYFSDLTENKEETQDDTTD